MRKRSWFTLGLLALLLVGIAVAAWFVLLPHGNAIPVKSSVTQTTVPHPTSLSTAETQRLQDALNSADKTAQCSILPTAIPGSGYDLRGECEQTTGSFFPQDTKVSILPETFWSHGTYGQVVAEVSGQGKFLLHLVLEDGHWYIFDTEKK